MKGGKEYWPSLNFGFKLPCDATGQYLKWRWQHNGTDIFIFSGGRYKLQGGSLTGEFLYPEQSGTYQCFVQDTITLKETFSRRIQVFVTCKSLHFPILKLNLDSFSRILLFISWLRHDGSLVTGFCPKLQFSQGELSLFPLATISTAVFHLSRRLQFRALCFQGHRKWSQLLETTRWNLTYIWNNSYLYCGCRWKWRMIIAVNFPI